MLKALLRIAAKVQSSRQNVTKTDVAEARNEGATDLEIHDTVLIATAFCMYNRYVDGLATFQPDDDQMGAIRVREGHHSRPLTLKKNEAVTEAS